MADSSPHSTPPSCQSGWEKLVLVAPAETLVMPNTGGLYPAVREQLSPERQASYGQYLGRFFGVFGSAFTRSERELVALNREFARYFGEALTAAGLESTAAEPAEGHDSGWGPFGLYFSLGMQYDLRPALARIRCPVLLIDGDADFVSSGRRDACLHRADR